MASKKCTPFGTKVKIALIEQGISSQELAKKIGYTNSTISDVIYGRNCSRMTKQLIAKELGIVLESGEDGSGVNKKILENP